MLALATLITGTVLWKVGDATILRNAHVARPLIVALLLATLAGRGVMAARVLFPAALLMLVLPMNAYEDVLRRARVDAHPLRSARDCLVGVRRGLGRQAATRPASIRSASSAGSCTGTSTICIMPAVGSGPRSSTTPL